MSFRRGLHQRLGVRGFSPGATEQGLTPLAPKNIHLGVKRLFSSNHVLMVFCIHSLPWLLVQNRPFLSASHLLPLIPTVPMLCGLIYRKGYILAHGIRITSLALAILAGLPASIVLRDAVGPSTIAELAWEFGQGRAPAMTATEARTLTQLAALLPFYLAFVVAIPLLSRGVNATATEPRGPGHRYSHRIRVCGGFQKVRGIKVEDVSPLHQEAIHYNLAASLAEKRIAVSPYQIHLGLAEGCVLLVPSVTLSPGAGPELQVAVEQALRNINLAKLLPPDLADMARRGGADLSATATVIQRRAGPEAAGGPLPLEVSPTCLAPFRGRPSTLALRLNVAAAGLSDTMSGIAPQDLRAVAWHTPIEALEAPEGKRAAAGAPVPVPLELVSPWKLHRGPVRSGASAALEAGASTFVSCRLSVPAALRGGVVSVAIGVAGPDGHVTRLLSAECAVPVPDTCAAAAELAATGDADLASAIGAMVSTVMRVCSEEGAAPVQYFGPQGPGHSWLSLAHEIRADVASLGCNSLASFLDRRIIKGLAEGTTERAEPGQNPLTLRFEDPILEAKALDLTYTAARQKRFWACCTVLAGAFSCLTMVPRSAWPWASYWVVSTAAMMAIARGWVRRGPKLGSALSEVLTFVDAFAVILLSYGPITAAGVAPHIEKERAGPFGNPKFFILCTTNFIFRTAKYWGPVRRAAPLFFSMALLECYVELSRNVFQTRSLPIYCAAHSAAALIVLALCYWSESVARRRVVSEDGADKTDRMSSGNIASLTDLAAPAPGGRGRGGSSLWAFGSQRKDD